MTTSERATWTTAYVNTLPDSSFLYVESGGSKDSEGKTTPRSLRHFPVKDANGKVDLPHLRNALARIPQSSLPADVKASCTAKAQKMLANANGGQNSMPKEGLVRAVFPAELELRSSGDAMPTMVGHFAVFDQWTEINSAFEGNFLERIAPSAFDKTFQETTPKVLFNHGKDPQIGDKVLGMPQTLESDATGARYEVPLLDTSYNRDLIPGLQANAYGASFRFTVMREDVVRDAKRSEYNPRGLPERTITEARVPEFGPVTFPAYANATAGIRSLTDRFRVAEFVADAGYPGLEERVDVEDLNTLACMLQAAADYIDEQDEPEDQANIPVMKQVMELLAQLVPVEVQEPDEDAEPEDEMASAATGTDVQAAATLATGYVASEPTTTQVAPPHPETPPRRDTQPDARRSHEDNDKEHMMSIEEMLERQKEIGVELKELAAENRGNLLSAADQARWDQLAAENDDLDQRIKAENDRQAYLVRLAGQPEAREDGAPFVNITRPPRDKAPDNPFDLASYHQRADSQEHLMRIYTDGAKRAMENIEFSDERADADKAKANMERVLSRDTPNREVALRILQYGAPTYRRAFGKYLAGVQLMPEEQRALGIASQGGQMPVPIQIDPTVTLYSNGVVNPLRRISRNVTVTGYEWRGVATAGVTSSYVAEGAISTDGSPTLIQPTIDVEQARCFVPFSFEVGQDWAGIEAELASAIADSKDVLEATAFLTGAGHASTQPKGVLRSCSTIIGTATNTNAGTVFTVQHVYELETALPPRFRPNASIVANKAVAQRIRQFDTGGGASLWTSYPNPLAQPMPDRLIGYPFYELSTMSTAVPSASGASWGLIGDFSQFVIADRVGMSIELIPQLFNGNTTGGLVYPVGQRGLFAWWRNSSDVMTSNAFRAGTQS